MKQFTSARLKLTAWYLLIIMLISVVFSLVIYHYLTREVERSLHVQQFRFQHEQGVFLRPDAGGIDPTVLEDARDRVKTTLILINLGILAASAGAGYFLAGRTLKPIEQIVTEQNRFITDASHELRTPLTALKSEMEITLREKELTLADAKLSIQNGLEEVNSLVLLSNSLLELAQYQKTNKDLFLEDVSLGQVIVEAGKTVTGLAKQKQISIINKVKDYSLQADKQRLTELFIILLDNAIKYSPKHSNITISSKKTDHSISINVADEGIGIKNTDIPHIFDRFYRVDVSRSKAYVQGFGLGLSIAKKIIEEHHGSITVQSTVGKGTIFTVQLPQTH